MMLKTENIAISLSCSCTLATLMSAAKEDFAKEGEEQ